MLPRMPFELLRTWLVLDTVIKTARREKHYVMEFSGAELASIAASIESFLNDYQFMQVAGMPKLPDYWLNVLKASLERINSRIYEEDLK